MSTRAQTEIEHVLDQHGAIAGRDHPELARAVRWLVESGRLTALLPGVYVRTEAASELHSRICALARSDPNAVLTRRAAAALSFWPDLRVDVVQAAVRTPRAARPGYSFERRSIHPDLLMHRHGLYLTSPAMTALDLVPDLGGDAIDRVLRIGAAKLPDLRRAFELTPHRPGNRLRLEMLLDSRDAPWAHSERLLHRILRAAGLTGWTSNFAARVAGRVVFLDVAFEHAKVAIDVDGWEFHARNPRDFDNTLRRHSALVAAGWWVLHFTFAHLVHEPDWVVATIRQTLEREKPPLLLTRPERPGVGSRPVRP